MRKFKDAQGTEWELEILIGEIPRLELETGVHLLKLNKPIEEDKEKWKDDEGQLLSGFERLYVDLPMLYRVIYSLCVDQVQELNLTPKEFGRRIAKVHQQVYDAFFEELKDFFHLIRQTGQATYVGVMQQMVQAAHAEMEEACSGVDANKIVSEWKAKMKSTIGEKSGELQEVLESTPAP